MDQQNRYVDMCRYAFFDIGHGLMPYTQSFLQDHLGYPPATFVCKFHYFLDPFDGLGTMPHPSDVRWAEDHMHYLSQFADLDQYTLAFVMFDKYDKKWDNKEDRWVKNA